VDTTSLGVGLISVGSKGPQPAPVGSTFKISISEPTAKARIPLSDDDITEEIGEEEAFTVTAQLTDPFGLKLPKKLESTLCPLTTPPIIKLPKASNIIEYLKE
jgi:hypothetical protein